MRHSTIATITLLTLTSAAFWHQSARGQSPDDRKTDTARQSAILSTQTELQELKQQIQKLRTTCGLRQDSATLATSSSARWLVVGSRQMWVPASQVNGVSFSGTAGITAASPNGRFGRSVSPTLAAFSTPAIQVTSFGLSGPLQSGTTFAGGIQTTPFTSVGNQILPASPYAQHASYGIYSEGAFTHQINPAGAGGNVPTYTTEQFRGVNGFVTTNAVPYFAAY